MHTYPNIINVKVMMLLCSIDPCKNIVGSNIWKEIRPLGSFSNPSRKCPGKTFKIKALNQVRYLSSSLDYFCLSIYKMANGVWNKLITYQLDVWISLLGFFHKPPLISTEKIAFLLTVHVRGFCAICQTDK